MCTLVSPNWQYLKLSLKQKVTILVTKLSLPAAISKAAVAIGSRTGSSQQPSQICSVCNLSRPRKIPHMSGVPLLLQTENWINADWTRNILRVLLFCPVHYFCSMQFFGPHFTFTCCGCPMRSCQTAAVCWLPRCLSHSKLHRISVHSPDFSLWSITPPDLTLSFAHILEPNHRYQDSTC
jgi:hypothetical protein